MNADTANIADRSSHSTAGRQWWWSPRSQLTAWCKLWRTSAEISLYCMKLASIYRSGWSHSEIGLLHRPRATAMCLMRYMRNSYSCKKIPSSWPAMPVKTDQHYQLPEHDWQVRSCNVLLVCHPDHVFTSLGVIRCFWSTRNGPGHNIAQTLGFSLMKSCQIYQISQISIWCYSDLCSLIGWISWMSPGLQIRNWWRGLPWKATVPWTVCCPCLIWREDVKI